MRGPRWRQFWIVVLPLTLAVVILSQSVQRPYEGLVAFYQYAVGGLHAWAAMMARSGPLILAGLAFAVSAQTSVVNLGIEGQLYAAALAAAWIGFGADGLPGWLHSTLATVAGMLIGAGIGGLIGWARIRYGVDEAITGIMFNYIIILFTSYMATYPLRDPTRWSGTTPLVAPTARYPQLLHGTELTTGIFLVIAAALCVSWLLRKTKLGLAWKLYGKNPAAALWNGFPTVFLVTGNMALSGALAGLCGALLVLGTQYRFWGGIGGSIPWDGILLSLLVQHRPDWMIPAGLLLAGFFNGMTGVESVTRMPSEVGQVLVALVLLGFLLLQRDRILSGREVHE